MVEAEVALLRSHGHEVFAYTRDNCDVAKLSRASVALQSLWSTRTVAEVEQLFNELRPDILHVHNTLALISPSIYWVASRRGIPVVQTLHNFRLLCPQGLMLRDERPCEDCVGKLPWRGVVHACYRGSRSQTAVLATMLTAHRAAGTWKQRITRYIALNEFCRQRFIEGGLPADRISVKPNFVDLPELAPTDRRGFLFVGRLSKEKGVQVMVDALGEGPLDEPVIVVGSGPEEALLRDVPGLQRRGALQAAEVYAEMAVARALVMPSIWYENFPRTLVEAFACGLPVIASRLGAMATLVDDGITGLLFDPGHAADLRAKLQWSAEHPTELAEMGRAARRKYEADLTPQSNYEQLMAIYAQAVRERPSQ